MTARTRVVVVGAGFAGLACAKALADAPVEVTIVDRNNFHTFPALLYQVATAGLTSADVVFPVRGIFRRQANVDFRHGTVTGVDWDASLLHLDDGTALGFDRLVVGAGATTNWFGVPGAEAHGFALYELADAIRLRNHLLQQFELAAADPSLVDAGALTIVVAGGGPTGVEISGALVELIDLVLAKDFKHLDVSRARVVLVERADELLRAFSPAGQRHAAEELRRRGVELRMGESVAEVEAGAVRFGDGEVLPCRTLVWAAGVRASPLAAVLGLPTGPAGRVPVGPDLRVADRPQCYVVGDLAAMDDGRGGVLPQLAPVAKQSGRFAGRAIDRELAGKPTGRFRFRDLGPMATIGRGAAVADLPGGIHLTGFPGWAAWLCLHLVRLVGVRNRVSVFFNWWWSYVTYDRGPRLIVPRGEPPVG